MLCPICHGGKRHEGRTCYRCGGAGRVHHFDGPETGSAYHGDRLVIVDGEPMYYCGAWDVDGENGQAGDVRLRPARLGPGQYTFTTSADMVEEG
jgi:hypothetical protein